MKKFIAVFVIFLMTACFTRADEEFYRFSWEPIYKSNRVEFYTVRRKIDDRNYKYGIADAKNNIILPIEYDFVHPINGKSAITCVYGYKNIKRKYGYFSFKERMFIFPNEYDNISCGYKAMNACQITKDNKYGYISYDGEELIPMEYKSTEVYHSDMLKSDYYRADKKYYIVAEDFNNKKCIYTIYSDSNDKWKSAKLTDCIYDEIEQIYSSRFSFKRDGKQGEISFYNYSDKKGTNKFIPYEYDNIMPFDYNSGVYVVEKDGKKGIYGANIGEHNFGSEIIVPVECDNIENAGWGLYKFCKEGKCGAYDKYAQRLIEPKYNDIIPVSSSKVRLITDKSKRTVSRYTPKQKINNFKDGFLMWLIMFGTMGG